MRRSLSADRVLATVLFTDIVGSTERAAELGDRRWRELVARHHAVVRTQLKHFRGREIDTAGDGFFATFERPARAIECALAIIDALRPLGLAIRAGVHAGELEMAGGKLGGIAVHTAARVVAAAGPGEVFVTATVRELVAGSQIEFEDRGTRTLKGVPGDWHLFAVVAPAPAAADAEDIAEPPVAASPTRARLSRLWAVIGVAAVLALLVIAAAVALPRLFAPPVMPGVDTVARVDAGGRAFELAVDVGSRPVGLTAGGGAVWVINFDNETLTRVEPVEGRAVDHSSVSGTPTGIAYGADAVWITTGFGLGGGEPGTLVGFSPSLGRVEDRIPVGNGVEAIAFGEGAVWVADRIREVALRINPSTNAVEQVVQVGRAPGGLAVGMGSIWVASALDGIVQRINTTTLVVEARIPVATPTAIAVGPGAVWVTSELGDTLTRVDTATNTATNFPVGDGPRGLAVAEDAVWVALGPAGQLVRCDPATGDVEAVLEVDGFADAVVVDEGGRVWVSVRAP